MERKNIFLLLTHFQKMEDRDVIAKATTKKKVVAKVAVDPKTISSRDLKSVRDLARRIRKTLCTDATDFMYGDDAHDLTRFLAIIEALAGVLEIELRMMDFVEEAR